MIFFIVSYKYRVLQRYISIVTYKDRVLQRYIQIVSYKDRVLQRYIAVYIDCQLQRQRTKKVYIALRKCYKDMVLEWSGKNRYHLDFQLQSQGTIAVYIVLQGTIAVYSVLQGTIAVYIDCQLQRQRTKKVYIALRKCYKDMVLEWSGKNRYYLIFFIVSYKDSVLKRKALRKC